MALSRRTGSRFQASIWPGFVDAMTGLLLVLMFLLTIFMVVQFVLRETISGQETELDALSSEVSALANALGLEERRSLQLETQVGTLDATIAQARTDLRDQAALIATLTVQRDQQALDLSDAQTRISDYQTQVAALLADQDSARNDIAALSAERADLLTERESLTAELAESRIETDAQLEAARLAAARREALEALIADLKQQDAQATETISALREDLDAEAAARLLESAATEALRARLENADAELTAMTLALEARRKEAEDTLTLLAAADAARQTLDGRLNNALNQIAANQVDASERNEMVDRLTRVLAQMELTQSQAEDDLAAVQSELDQTRSDQTHTESQLQGQLAEKQQSLGQAEAELARIKTELATARAAAETTEEDRIAIEARLLESLEKLERAQATASDRDLLQEQLSAALAAQLAAQNETDTQLTLAEQRSALLAQARETLSEEQEISAKAQQQTALLNQQVAALRSQLGALQALLDDYEERDAAANVQLQSLGSDLNAALARAASEQRKRRLLEEAERKRLEEEARALEAQARALEAETKQLSAQAQDLERYRSEFFGRLRDLLGNREGVRIEGDRFVFSSEVLFPPGGANLSVEGEDEIAKVARILRSVAQEIPPEIDWVIRVDGHTDNIPLVSAGKYSDNWELSQGRALSVVRHMINFLGVPPERLSANGFGQYQPVNPQDTPDARAQNRRIELKLTER